jgi:hypothetical protein
MAKKIISDFDGTSESDNLMKFLNTHWACIELFYMTVKNSNEIDADLLLQEIKMRDFKSLYQTSFVKEAKCRCGIHKVQQTLPDLDFKQPTISEPGPKCKRCHQQPSGFYDTYNYEYWHMQKMCQYGVKHKILEAVQYVFCPWCDRTPFEVSENNINNKCIECKEKIEVKLAYRLTNAYINIAGNRDGYWFEWYIGRLVNSKEWNIELDVKGEKAEVDVILERQNKRIAIICDISAEPEFDDVNHALIKDEFDALVLVSLIAESNFKSKVVASAKQIFGRDKVEVITSSKITDIDHIIDELCKRI